MEKFLKYIVLRISKMIDYFVILEGVTLSEFTMLGASFNWFVWFLFFDVENSTTAFRYIYSETMWTCAFGVLVFMHIAGLLTGKISLRVYAVEAGAVFWLVWLFIIAASAFTSQMSSTIIILLITNIILAVRLRAERSLSPSEGRINSK